jgi:hypothetical protein
MLFDGCLIYCLDGVAPWYCLYPLAYFHAFENGDKLWFSLTMQMLGRVQRLGQQHHAIVEQILLN